MDTIEIRNLRLRAQIGFSTHELDAPQDVVINLRIHLADRRAGETDDPADAFNYRTVTKAVIRLVEGARFALVEKLAEEIARLAVVDFGAPSVEVSVSKPGALRRSDSVGIQIKRGPDDYARNIAYLSLGSNIDPEANLAAAIDQLRRLTTVLALSSVYQTRPQGYAQQEHFLNMAVKLRTLRTPAQFKTEVIDRIESALKRVHDPKNANAPRTIDLDISLWNDEVIQFGAKPWTIPDADIAHFAYVAIPLAELAPEYIHPQLGKSLKEIAAPFKSDEVNRLDLKLTRN
ncbi:MAG: 2-amino-4-hydroxy-6-hydroxymethyldihydropteridine diphosphokinase [Chloroflexi bacterium]|nr:2-amino-4-hydroxy-6-hydroxymethyldihydropteridine diphosphokinase [Chloroflexota bacterium]